MNKENKLKYECPFCKESTLLFTIPTRALFLVNDDGTIGLLVNTLKSREYIENMSDKPPAKEEKIELYCPACHSIYEAKAEEDGSYTVGKKLQKE